MLLSLKSDVQVQQLLWRVNAEEVDPTKRMSINDLLREINQIRAQKYAMTEGTINPNSGVIAIDMPTPKSQPPMALGIGASIEMLRTDRERLLQLLNEAVRPYRGRLANETPTPPR
jgi:DNA-binding IclR family transcriptional regulator